MDHDSTNDRASAPPKQQQPPSIFLKPKKPTSASVGTRPLLKPFKNDSIDYNNPGKHDPKPNRLTAFAPGIPISIPGGSASASSTTSSTASPTAKAPFSFDNHTDDAWRDSTQSKGRGAKRSMSIADETDKNKLASSGSAADANEGLTILRIKRRRNEEPLDTLVVQQQLEKQSGKKQRRIEDEVQQEIENALSEKVSVPKPPAVFRLATTVNKESFKDPTQSLQLRNKIANMAESSSSSSSRPRSRIGDRHGTPTEFGERVQERRGELAEAKQKEARSARYRVINQNRAGLNSSKKLPPEVKSSVEVEAEAALDMFKMYDAVKEDEPKSKKQIDKEAEESDIMCNFLPMVREYLSISDNSSDPKISVDKDAEDSSARSSLLAQTSKPKKASGEEEDEDSDDEYVYDIYYRDVHADHNHESKHRAIGSLLWFSDDENNFMNEDDSSDDDYEDSDSNAEDYYQNDYPEDELSDEDMPYELSASDDEDDYMY